MTIRKLEDLVLDFSQQLSAVMAIRRGAADATRRNNKISIELVDRKKPAKVDGCAYTLPNLGNMRLVLTVWLRSLATRSLNFPQSAKQASSRPIGEAQSESMPVY